MKSTTALKSLPAYEEDNHFHPTFQSYPWLSIGSDRDNLPHSTEASRMNIGRLRPYFRHPSVHPLVYAAVISGCCSSLCRVTPAGLTSGCAVGSPHNRPRPPLPDLGFEFAPTPGPSGLFTRMHTFRSKLTRATGSRSSSEIHHAAKISRMSQSFVVNMSLAS